VEAKAVNSFWDFFWLMLSIFLFFAYLIVMFHILIDLFRDKDVSGGMKAVWVVFLIFFPILTALVYLIARGGGMAQRQLEQMQAAQAQADAYIKSVASSGSSPADEIARAKSLLDSGSITQAEYDQLKAKALG
jgi:Phospholipase_D-nuclease N-terminal/Short C-terminal domain